MSMQFLLVLSITRLVSAPIVVFVAFMQSVCDLQVLLYKFFGYMELLDRFVFR